MTANQIAYAKLVEDRRHNKVTESETGRHNVQQEGIGWAGVRETGRHNVATETINWYTAENLAQLQGAQTDKTLSEVGETQRHNVASENISKQQLYETQRHNVEQERDTDYANKTDRAEAWTGGIQDVSRAVFGTGGVMSLLKPKSK